MQEVSRSLPGAMACSPEHFSGHCNLGLSSGEVPLKIPYHSEQCFKQNVKNLARGNY